MSESTESKAQDTQPQVNEQRRRLTRGGLAAPIVLGTLLSRPVLGAAPYNCTISGQLSGNTSSHGDPVDCNTLGLSPGFWLTHESWPDPYVYGAPPAGQCPVNETTATQAATPGTRFNNAEALGSKFLDIFRCVAITEETTTPTYTNGQCLERYTKGFKKGQCKTYEQIPATTTSTAQTGCEVVNPSDSRFATGVPATLLQVLQTGGGLNDTDIAALGRAAVASLLSAAQFGTEYPLTGKQVIEMFNAVCKGGTYLLDNGVSWNANQVKTYFESLYGGKD